MIIRPYVVWENRLGGQLGLSGYCRHSGLDPESRNVLFQPTFLSYRIFWIPAFAGMTVWIDNRKTRAGG